MRSRATSLVLTGVVTCDDVVVSPQVAGQIGRLLVDQGEVVRKGQLLAVIAPDELKAETAYYEQSAEGVSAQVRAAQADLHLEQRQTTEQIRQAESTLASTRAQAAAAAAEREQAQLTYERDRGPASQGIVSPQDLDLARATADASRAKAEALEKSVEAQRAALALARASAEQVRVKRSQLQTNEHLQAAAAAAQSAKADVRLRYTELRAPIDGVVDVRRPRRRGGRRRAAGGHAGRPRRPLGARGRRGELRRPAAARPTGWSCACPPGPSARARSSTAVDAGFATQRDVSRTKRDIKTFELRLRVDNADRRLALGMTAYVLLPVR